jgi:phage-related holin
MSKISISLPDDLVKDIDTVSGVVGFSRSALITYYMTSHVNSIISVFGDLPLDVPSNPKKRARGESLDELHRRMKDIGANVVVATYPENFAKWNS